MLFSVAPLPVAIVFQKHLLPDVKDEWGWGCREREVRLHYFNSFFSIRCKTCPSWHQLSPSLSLLYSFSVSMTSIKKPWIKFPTWETHLSGDVNAWLTPLPVGLQTWLSLMVLECWHAKWQKPNTGRVKVKTSVGAIVLHLALEGMGRVQEQFVFSAPV